MSVPDPKTPLDWALLAVAQWGRSEEFPGHPFPGLVGYIELAIRGAVKQALKETAAGMRRRAVAIREHDPVHRDLCRDWALLMSEADEVESGDERTFLASKPREGT